MYVYERVLLTTYIFYILTILNILFNSESSADLKHMQQKNSRSDYMSYGGKIARDSSSFAKPTEPTKLVQRIWPMMQDTLNNLMRKVTAGANMVKNILVPKKSPKRKPKPILQSAPVILKTSAPSKAKPEPTIETKPLHKPVFMEHDISGASSHEYKPSYLIKSETKPFADTNPYADMGVKGFKHFQDTVLRKLEEEEERKFEATMHTFHYNNKNKLSNDHLIHKGHSQDDWKPMKPKKTKSKGPPKKAHIVSQLNTNIHKTTSSDHHDVETSDEKITYEETVEKPITVLPDAKNHHGKKSKKAIGTTPSSVRVQKITTTVPPITSTESENYPMPFLLRQKQEHLQTTTDRTSNYRNTPRLIPANLSNFVVHRHQELNHFAKNSSDVHSFNYNDNNVVTPYPNLQYRPFRARPTNSEFDTKEASSSHRYRQEINKNSRGNVKFGS